jgi:hypothetical protein
MRYFDIRSRFWTLLCWRRQHHSELLTLIEKDRAAGDSAGFLAVVFMHGERLELANDPVATKTTSSGSSS